MNFTFLAFRQHYTTLCWYKSSKNFGVSGRDIHRVLQIVQMKLILLCVWEERTVLGSAKTALDFKYEI